MKKSDICADEILNQIGFKIEEKKKYLNVTHREK